MELKCFRLSEGRGPLEWPRQSTLVTVGSTIYRPTRNECLNFCVGYTSCIDNDPNVHYIPPRRTTIVAIVIVIAKTVVCRRSCQSNLAQRLWTAMSSVICQLSARIRWLIPRVCVGPLFRLTAHKFAYWCNHSFVMTINIVICKHRVDFE